jgi:hypothetical protein
VIRHKEDYGNIILVDSRFAQKQQIESISGWLRQGLRVYQNPSDAIQDYKSFFARMKAMNFKPKVAQLSQVKLEFADEDEDVDLKDAVA